MNPRLDAAQAAFVSQVQALLEASRPGAGTLRDALAERGWTVPCWPRRWGGAALPAGLAYLLDRSLVAAGLPVPDPVAADLIGPAILALGGAGPGARWLPGIADGSAVWAVHGSVHGGAPLDVRGRGPGEACLRGTLRVRDVRGADHLLAVVRHQRGPGTPAGGLALAVVVLDAPQQVAGLPRDPDGLDVAGLPVDVLGPFRRQEVLRAELDGLLGRSRAAPRCRSLLLGRRLARLRGRHPAVRGRCHELEVGVVTLSALEHRASLAPVGPAKAEALRRAAWVRARELGAAVAALALDALGYHALPAPEVLTQHNEMSPAGEDAMEELMRYVGGLDTWRERDRIAAAAGVAGEQ